LNAGAVSYISLYVMYSVLCIVRIAAKTVTLHFKKKKKKSKNEKEPAWLLLVEKCYSMFM